MPVPELPVLLSCVMPNCIGLPNFGSQNSNRIQKQNKIQLKEKTRLQRIITFVFKLFIKLYKLNFFVFKDKKLRWMKG